MARYYHYQCLNHFCASKEAVVLDVRTDSRQPVDLRCPLCQEVMDWSASSEADSDGFLGLVELRKDALRDVAAYVLDRADQYHTESGCWVALTDVAHNIMRGEVETAKREGTLDADVYKRVDGFRGDPKPVDPNLGMDED